MWDLSQNSRGSGFSPGPLSFCRAPFDDLFRARILTTFFFAHFSLFVLPPCPARGILNFWQFFSIFLENADPPSTKQARGVRTDPPGFFRLELGGSVWWLGGPTPQPPRQIPPRPYTILVVLVKTLSAKFLQTQIGPNADRRLVALMCFKLQ